MKYWTLLKTCVRPITLTEARYFVYKLKEKSYFVDSIMRFNKKSGKNWLDERNIAVLGGYLCSFCLTLKPVLKVVKKGTMNCLKPKLSTRDRPDAE